MQWVLQPTKLTRAGKMLGLKHPVLVRRSNGYWSGTHDVDVRFANSNITLGHMIRVHYCIPIHHDSNPSWTLWHELGHALQFERDYKSNVIAWEEHLATYYDGLVDDDDKPTDTSDEWYDRYESLPMEIEAEEIAKKYAFRHPLVRLVGS